MPEWVTSGTIDWVYFRDTLVDMLTTSDLQKLEKKFVTKDEFTGGMKSIKDLIVEFKDAILKEIKDMRDEVAIVTGYKDQIEDHETRIETV